MGERPARAADFPDAFIGLATALAGVAGRSHAQSATASQPRTVQTDALEIGYEEHGNPAGTAIVLLHGFPFDVRSFDGVGALFRF